VSPASAQGKGPPSPPSGSGLLPRDLCRVIGLNHNYTSRSGTVYHVQVEDRGPVFEEATEGWVRRVNAIVYANDGEPTARIVHGRDLDFPDVRTQEHNRFIEARIQEMARDAKALLEEREERLTARVKALLRQYYQSRDEAAKQELDEVNRLFPLVFARAWQELKAERALASPEAEAPLPEIDETVYPLDPSRRDLVLEIERLREELERDLAALKIGGAADDILLATCAKILYRAHESLTQRAETGSDFAAKRLEMTRNSLVTTYRQVRARLNRFEGQKT